MHTILRRLPLVALAATLLCGALAPAMAQAAPLPRAQPKTVQFAPNPVERQVTAGAYHELFILTHFYTPVQIKPAYFTIHFNGALYGRPATSYLGTLNRGMHDLDFVAVVPARTHTGVYKGVGRLLRGNSKRDDDHQVGGNFYVVVRVVRAPRHETPIIRWQPANNLGAIPVQRGQTVTETVSFTSNVALTNVHVARDLGNYAQSHGVRVRVSPSTPSVLANVAPGVAVPVIFTISAGRVARLGVYPADLHVDAATKDDGRVLRRPNDLDFRVAVRPVAAVIHWQPANSLGVIAVQRGQTITETASFTSAVDLTNVRLAGTFDYPDRAEDSRVSVRVVSPISLPSVAANTPVSVTFTIRGGYRAPLGGYNAGVHVVGTEPGGPRAVLPYDLDFRVQVRRDAAVIYWQPANQLGTVTVQRGQTVTETATFSSSVDLTNASLTALLSVGEDQREASRVRLAVISPNPAAPINVTAGAPVSVTFTVQALAGAPLRAYPAIAYIVGTEQGGPRATLHYGLHFTVRVTGDTPVIHWQPANSLGALKVQRGQTITETATFSSDVALSNAEIVRDLSDNAREHGVSLTVLSPATPVNIVQGAPVTVMFAISAAPAARIAAYPAALYVKASLFGGPATALHYGLHFTIVVDAAPATTVAWTGGNNVAYNVSPGSVVTETATFTTSADVSNASLRLVYGQRLKGVHISLVPLSGATPGGLVSITANTPQTINIVITTSPKAAGIFGGDVYLIAQPANAGARQLLHYGLHFTGAVQ